MTIPLSTTDTGGVMTAIGHVDVEPVVSQGGRPYGQPPTVTRSDRTFLYQVAGIGATIRFHLRDAASADSDLRALLRGTRADGALLFTGFERGWRLFGEPHHDASVLVAGEVGGVPMGGFAGAGELGPLGGQNFVHRATASMARFQDR
ncbi:MAG: FIST C-terminal domain-containing protein [Acidimicrobiales bacterium]